MKGFETGVGYLRNESLKYGLIQDSDNNDKLIERLARVIRGQDPFGGDAEEAERAESVRMNALGEQEKKKILERADESGSDKESE